MKNEIFEFFVSTAKGMEPLLALELTDLGVSNINEARAGVSFHGTLTDAYKVCLYSRVANRLLLVLKRVEATNARALYEGVKSILWHEHLAVENTFAVDFSINSSPSLRNKEIIHSHFAALKVKDAIADHFRAKVGARPFVDVIRPDVRINAYLLGNEATISIDLSGDSLHKRGYRAEGDLAPLKENLAAAILLLADWHKSQEKSFIDPMCGSGTLPIEAGLMAKKVAPGLLRNYFGFLGWLGHMPKIWQELKEEAKSLVIKDPKKLPPIVGYDRDSRALKIATDNVLKSGLKDVVSIKKQELSLLKPVSEHSILVVNPPYGERLGEIEKLRPLYKELGDIMKQRFKGSNGYIFTSNPELAKCIGLKASRRFVLFNGSLECRLLKYDLY